MQKIDKLLNEVTKVVNELDSVWGPVIVEQNQEEISLSYIKYNRGIVYKKFESAEKLKETLDQLNTKVIITDDIDDEPYTPVHANVLKTPQKKQKDHNDYSYTKEEKEQIERQKQGNKEKKKQQVNNKDRLKYDDPLKEALFRYD